MSGPLISIVIPSYKRPEQLAACVAAISRLDYSRDRFEVIVVDDGSTPALSVPEPYRLFRQPNAGPASARNRGAAEAAGELLVFLDDDCRPRPDWLAMLVAAWKPGLLVTGAARNALRANRYAAFNERLLDAVTEWFAAQRHPLQFVTSSNLLVEAEAFRAMGGFSTSFPLAAGEDRDFSSRWMDRGGELQIAPEAVVDHHHAQTLFKFVEMHFRYGRGAALFHRTRGTRAEPIRSHALYGYLLRRCQSLVLLALSQAATAAGYCFEMRKSPRS